MSSRISRPKFTVGSRVKLNHEGAQNENYSRFVGKTLVVTHTATRYMTASEFYAKGRPDGFHPGFDPGAGCALYDLKDCPFSLYEWEIEAA